MSVELEMNCDIRSVQKKVSGIYTLSENAMENGQKILLVILLQYRRKQSEFSQD